MSSLIDISGQVFGRLTVQDYQGQRKWSCRCSCGKIVTVRADHLKSGSTLSCGCIKAAQDLSGLTFGEWLVVKRTGNTEFGSPLFECQCSCGTIAVHQSSNLLSGSTSSCGCIDRARDLTDKKFGRLTPLYRIECEGPVRYLCKCDCGNHKILFSNNIIAGKSRSCGCLDRELKSKRGKLHKTHGLSRTRVYGIYQGMLSRCCNPNASNYDIYGGKGVTVSPEWLESFENFYSDMGDPPSHQHSLDRFPPDSSYSKETCRWATAKEQGRNKTGNHFLTFCGITKCVSEWAEITGLSNVTISKRISYGWSIEDALTKQPKRNKYKINPIDNSKLLELINNNE